MRVTIGHSEHASIHRLVAETYISNPENKEHVNHIDGNRHNNAVQNLEWCTRSENVNHAYLTGLNNHQIRVQITETGETFDSQIECAKAINGKSSAISECLSGKRRTHKGFHFNII